MGQEKPRWTRQIERDIRDAEVLLERGRVTDPLAQALREHEVRVREPQDVAAVRRHSVLTSSGIS